jgi:hypothetical protein
MKGEFLLTSHPQTESTNSHSINRLIFGFIEVQLLENPHQSHVLKFLFENNNSHKLLLLLKSSFQ